MGALAPAVSSASDINPYPRAALTTEKLVTWTFAADTAGWTAAHDCRVTAEGGALKITSTGDDPYLIGPAVRVACPLAVSIRIKADGGGPGQFFWTTAEAPNFGPDKVATFPLKHDNQWHEYTVPLSASGTFTRLRLDPGSAPGQIEVASIGLVQTRLHPLEIERVEQAPGEVRADVRNHAADPTAFTVSGRAYTVEGGKTVRVTLPTNAAKPFEAITLAVESKGLPPVRRTAFVFNPEAKCEWLTRTSGDLTLRIAPDGSGARIESGGTLVAVLAPLVHRDGVVPQLKAGAASAGDLTMAGDGVAVIIGVRPNHEVAVRVESDKPVEGPVVRAIGGLQAGVLAGVEYLGKGEQSSSDLDLETPDHIRFAPDPLKLTMPLMACVTDRGAVAVTWQDMGLQPVYASPNFFDGAADHRMTLCGTNIEATILVQRDATIEDAILWAVRQHGLPPLPAPPRDAEAQTRLSLAALNGPIKGEGGWGHCAEAKWQRHPFADMVSTLWRLTGEAPSVPNLVPGGAHIRNDAAYFVTGRAAEWLRMRAGQAKGVLAAQKPDGSWRYAGKFLRGHYEDTASGHCGMQAVTLLDHAYATGDAAALEGGLKALEYMKRFDVPRGAQTWELSLHTPDILASAHLVSAYVRGYQLTGKPEHLVQARKWAITGVPFVYQWTCRPTMLYATTPVLGATGWQAPNWIGLPVQWCGLDYAYAVARLAPHDKTLDWQQLARGILVSAEMQQAPDGPMIGCLPDSFSLDEQRRNGPFINPCAIESLRAVLDGKLDALAVAVSGNRRVVAPFPVTIQGAKAIIQARKGVAYQVVIDGKRIVDVKSEGTDTVPLD
jgi:hypothetical protein